MVLVGTIKNDASTIESIFEKYKSCLEDIKNDSIWQGISRDNAYAKGEDFFNEYKFPIVEQMNDLANAVKLFTKYKTIKEKYELANAKYKKAISDNVEDKINHYFQIVQEKIMQEKNVLDKTMLERIIQEKSIEMEELRRQINTILENIKSVKLTATGIYGEFINYYQTDYKEYSYGYNTTIASAGCGPTAMAMVLTYMTGEPVTPPEAAEWSMDNGYRVEGEGTSWGYYGAISEEYGLDCEQSDISKSKIIEDLSNGKIIITSMKPGHFTREGHYIVLTGITSDGKITVADPNSKTRSEQTWNLDIITSEAKQMWSFS